MKFFGKQMGLAVVRKFSASVRKQLPRLVTIEMRDWIQSSMNGWPRMTPNIKAYLQTINAIYHAGKHLRIKSLMAFGGTWYQLPAMYDDNPFDVWRDVVAATPAKPGQKALPLELLQRSSHQFGLEEVNQDIIRETYRKLAEIAGPDREIIIRLFHFNNRDMQKDSTYAAIKELREQGVKNFVISDEHSYATFMENDEVAQGIITGLLRNVSMTSGDVDYPLQGGIKDFSGSLAPQDAKEILYHLDRKIKQEANRLAIEGYTVDAQRLLKVTITLHSHLTDRSEHTVAAFEQVGEDLGINITTHRIHNVENATHHVLSDEGLTPEELVLHREGETLLAKIVTNHKSSVVKDYEPFKARPWTGFAGGGTPMIQQFVNLVANLYKLTPKEASALLYRHMEAVRDRNNIPTVTPAQKGVTDLAFLRIANEKAGRPLYEGTFTSEAIDVVRNLHPEMAEDKEMLEGAFRQYRAGVLNRYEKEKSISPAFKQALQDVGMNSDRSSLDKDKTQAVIAAFAAQGEALDSLVHDEIIEACGAATRPTRLPDQMAQAREIVADLKARNALKLPEDEAVLIIASLRGRKIGETLAEHHGDKTKFPALQTPVQKPVIGVKVPSLWASNVAGDVLPEVVSAKPRFSLRR